MNIVDFWPKLHGPIESSAQMWLDELIPRRRATFQGFYLIEVASGTMPEAPSVNSALGQEALRILSFRVIEEASESHAADEPAHRKEEAIDAFNYLISMPILVGKVLSDEQLAIQLQEAMVGAKHHEFMDEDILSLADIGFISYQLGYELADYYRNRGWMYQTQDIYFNGKEAMERVIFWCARRLLKPFKGFDEFYRYFVAKDDVLQFRLRTDY